MRAVKVVWRDRFSSDRPFEREFSGLRVYEPVSRSHDGLMDILQLGRNDAAGYFYYVMELADAAGGAGPERCRTRTRSSGIGGRDGAAPRETAAGGRPPTDPSVAVTAESLGVPLEGYDPLTLGLLARLQPEKRLPFAECVRHFISLAGGLEALHRTGLAHRDVKPSNIILVGGVAKLADVGLVAEMSESRSYVGTEGFIPPEGPGTPEADIYALGKVLYEVSTGLDRLEFPRLPLNREGPDRALLELNDIVLRACAPDAASRYRSAAEMLADLALLQAGQSVRERHRTADRLRIARRTGMAAAVAAVITAGGFGWAQWRAAEERGARQEKEKLLVRAVEAEKTARASLYSQALVLAKAECGAREQGHRFRALEAIAGEARLHPGDPALRDAAITALCVPDWQPLRSWPAAEGLPPPFAIVSQCWSPDLRSFARGDAGGALTLVTPADGGDVSAPLQPATVDGEPRLGVGPFSPDGRFLAVQNQDHSIEVLEVASRRKVHAVPPTEGKQTSQRFEFSRDSKLFFFPQLDAKCLVVHTLDGSAPDRRIALDFKPRVMSFAVHTDRALLGSRTDGTIRLVDPATGQVSTFPSPGGGTDGMCLSVDGTWLASQTADFTFQVKQPGFPDEAPIALAGHRNFAPVQAFHPTAPLLVTGGWDSLSFLFSLGERQFMARSGRQILGPLVWSADGTRLGSVDSASFALQLAEVATGDACLSLPVPEPFGLAWAGGGRLLAVGGRTEVRLLDADTGLLAAVLPGGAISVATGPDGGLFTAGDGGLLQWRLDPPVNGGRWTAHPVKSLDSRRFRIVRTARNGTVLAVNAEWDTWISTAGEPLRKIPSFTWDLEISTDGRRLLTAYRSTEIVDLDTEKVAGHFQLTHPIFSHDGRCLYGVNVQSLEAWDIASASRLWHTALPGQALSLMALSPDSTLLAAIVEGGEVLLLDPATGARLAVLRHPVPEVANTTPLFSPDSQRLVISCGGGRVRLWNLARLRDGLRRLNLDW